MEEWADLAGDDGGGYSFRDMPAGAFLTPQYLAAPYVFELNDEATNVFNEYIDKVNGKAGPEYEPGGDEIAGAYWRKSTDKVLQLAGRLRLFDWAAKKPGAFTEAGEPNIRLDADVLRRSIELYASLLSLPSQRKKIATLPKVAARRFGKSVGRGDKIFGTPKITFG